MTDENPKTDNLGTTQSSSSQTYEKTRFKTSKQFYNDFKKFFSSTPATHWDANYIGEAIADNCHPQNTTFAIGAIGIRIRTHLLKVCEL